jgi:tRNA-dihydrouridine synthase B
VCIFVCQINCGKLKIGNIDLGFRPLLLAPMEDVTDPSFRLLCKKFGADMMYTEFINADGLIRDARTSVAKLDIYEYERPIGIQIYGHEIDSMVEATRVATAAKPDVIDINFGCPVKKIANRGAGSGMMRDIPKMVEMTSQIVNATNIPVTVKTRLGWDDASKNIFEIAEQLQDVGIKALTIHGRTRAQLYKGEADWTLIGEVKNNQRMKIPIIGNGDIDSPEKARLAFETYGVDGIMIGRATYGRPWIFKEIKHYLATGEKLKPFTIPEKVELAKFHLMKSLEIKGDKTGIFELRRHLTSYFKGLPHFKEMRLKLVTSMDPMEISMLLDEVAKKYANFTPDEMINPSPWVY